MTEYGGRGDPRRSLALLWRDERVPARGPKPGLSIDRIVAAAIALADADGLAQLSMRRVADRLGVGTMSLYTYVPAKAELLDLMLDTVLGEIVVPADQPGERPPADQPGGERPPAERSGGSRPLGDRWRDALEARALADWTLYARHPWVLQVSGARAVLGPNETALYEAALASLANTGLAPRDQVAVVTLVTGYVRGAAQGIVEARTAEGTTGVSDDSWWAEREAVFSRYYDPARYPALTALERAGAFAPEPDYIVTRTDADFRFGLQRVLDGIAAYIDQGAQHG